MKQGCDGGLQFVFGVGNGQAMACLDKGSNPDLHGMAAAAARRGSRIEMCAGRAH